MRRVCRVAPSDDGSVRVVDHRDRRSVLGSDLSPCPVDPNGVRAPTPTRSRHRRSGQHPPSSHARRVSTRPLALPTGLAVYSSMVDDPPRCPNRQGRLLPPVGMADRNENSTRQQTVFPPHRHAACFTLREARLAFRHAARRCCSDARACDWIATRIGGLALAGPTGEGRNPLSSPDSGSPGAFGVFSGGRSRRALSPPGQMIGRGARQPLTSSPEGRL
jgi:hypothetical protein